jgi:hypothetical protein
VTAFLWNSNRIRRNPSELCTFCWNSMESGWNSNGNCSGRLPDSNHSARFQRIPSEFPWNWKPEWLRLQPTEFRRIPTHSAQNPPELMGDGKDLCTWAPHSVSADGTTTRGRTHQLDSAHDMGAVPSFDLVGSFGVPLG